MSNFIYPHRVEGLRRALTETRFDGDTPVDAVLISYMENVRYLTGFSGSNGLVLLTRGGDAVFFTDGRYALQSSREVPGWERVIMPQGSSLAKAAVGEIAKRADISTVGFESAHLTVAGLDDLQTALEPDNEGNGGAENVTLVAKTDLAEALRRIKDANEIEAIRRAARLADDCFAWVCENVRPGMTELELAWQMETFMRQSGGAQRLSFDSIVGSGPQSALIHGRPSARVLGASGEPEFLLLDFGAELNGYCSDITRTLVIGGEPTDEQRKLYDAVLTAQLAALGAIAPGKAGKDIDQIARDSLTGAGYGEAFGHSLGHGLGRVVHDGPAFAQTSKITLAAGMVVTVEPGAYIENLGGVRIEDDVVVTENGCEILTQSPKELIVRGG